MTDQSLLKIGDKVWFISKFGDTVTGTYKGTEDHETANGFRRAHLVESYDAFGSPSKDPTNCLVFGEVHLQR